MHFSLILISCNENELDLNNENLIDDNIGYNSNHGFLIFENEEILHKTISHLNKATINDISLWESRFFNYESQHSISENAYTEDSLHLNKLEKLNPQELDEYKKSHGKHFIYSDFTRNNSSLFSFNDQYNFYNLNVSNYNPNIIYVINRNGFVQVGDSIFQYTPNQIKIINDGDISKIEQLESVLESSKELNISVIDIVRITDPSANNLKLMFQGNEQCIGYTGGGGQRVIGQSIVGFQYTIDIYKGTYIVSPYAILKATNQNKHWLTGWSKKRTTQLEIIGTNLSYSFPGIAQGSNLNVHKTTSSLTQELTADVFRYGWIPATLSQIQNWVVNFSGNATFKGRDGSVCGL